MPHPMPLFGTVSLFLALLLSVYTLLAGTLSLWAIAHGRALAVAPERIRETARRAGIASFIAVTAASFALIWAFTTNDFSVDYVLHHSSIALPWYWKFSSIWAGQEGSL